jgi:conjugative relaxase-like TrwC/TraI family protein
MLRIIVSASVGQAKKYYSEGLTREGYYSEGQEMAGQWGGLAAEKLGLQGPVTKEAFAALCDNLNPATGKRLTGRTLDNRRVGYDFNFHVPKSVTLAYHWHKDERILTAFRESVQETMREMQQDAAARVRVNGQEDGDRKTRNLVWAEFIHFTARPVDGYPDPHLHAHCFTFNATHDQVENKWKAVQFGDIKYDASYFEARFRARLAEKLAVMGYEIEPLGGSFELAGISRSLIEKFSRRSKVVEEKARQLGITSAAGKDSLAAVTREKKVKDLSIPQLETLWWPKLTPQDKDELNGLGKRYTQSQQPAMAESRAENGLSQNNQAVAFAIRHVFERASLVSERELLKEAHYWGYGRTTLEGVEKAVSAAPLIRIRHEGRIMVTTMEVQAEEDRIIARCEKGKHLHPAINPSWVIKDERLSYQQRQAVFHILHSHDFVTGVVGKSGAGKTTALLEAAKGIEAAGQKVIALAPSAQASRGTLRKSGFPEAETVARMLSSPELQAKGRGAVWFVDEAGLMSSRSTDKLLEVAERLGARVVMVGDSGQHHSVERGDAFRLLHGVGSLSVATVDEVRRQTGQYKQAVELWSQGKRKESLDTFEQMGAVREIYDSEKRYAAIAEDFVAALQSGKTALLVAPTHAECNVVNLRSSFSHRRRYGGKICSACAGFHRCRSD